MSGSPRGDSSDDVSILISVLKARVALRAKRGYDDGFSHGRETHRNGAYRVARAAARANNVRSFHIRSILGTGVVCFGGKKKGENEKTPLRYAKGDNDCLFCLGARRKSLSLALISINRSFRLIRFVCSPFGKNNR